MEGLPGHPGSIRTFPWSTARIIGSKFCPYVYRPLQSAVDRAFVGNLKQPPLLFVRKSSRQPYLPLESIDSCSAGRNIARLAVHCVDFFMRDIDVDVIKRPALASCIHSNGHRRARSEAR